MTTKHLKKILSYFRVISLFINKIFCIVLKIHYFLGHFVNFLVILYSISTFWPIMRPLYNFLDIYVPGILDMCIVLFHFIVMTFNKIKMKVNEDFIICNTYTDKTYSSEKIDYLIFVMLLLFFFKDGNILS